MTRPGEADRRLAHRAPGGHWLTFNDAREITGCHCGFQADEEECGYGDSVLDHFQEVVERQVREQVAQEIMAKADDIVALVPWRQGYRAGVARAARIARGSL